jgi:beta-glucosidase
MAAKESRLHGVNWYFEPMVDFARDSRWRRVSEGPGKDPYTASDIFDVNGFKSLDISMD